MYGTDFGAGGAMGLHCRIIDGRSSPGSKATHPGRRPVRRAVLAALFMLLPLFGGCKSKGAESNRSVAIVNGRPITYLQYQDVLKRLVPVNSAESVEDLLEIKKDLVNRLIEEELILQEAARLAVTVSDGEVSAEVEGLKDEYGEESFREAIAERYGTFENWKERIRRKLLIRKTIDRVTALGALPTEADALQYYEEHADAYEVPEQARARMIVVADNEEALKIRASLTQANFASIAKEKSLSPEKAAGGDLGFFGRGDMPQEFEDVVFSLKPGQISAVVKTEYGYHIFLLEEKRKAGELKFSDVKDRIMDTLALEMSDDKFVDWMVGLKKSAEIKVREEML